MQRLDSLFGDSPFRHLVDHARKIDQCVALVRPIAEAILAGETEKLRQLQDDVSKAEYEADLIKDEVRTNLPRRFYLPVQREDVLNVLRQLDRMGDDCEDFAVVATLRRIQMPDDIREAFLALVDKVVQVSSSLLDLAEQLASLQKASFEGPETEAVLKQVERVCYMEWETDKLSRRCARAYYADDSLDAVTIILLEKLCKALTGIADHAENVGKNLRLMISRA